MLHVIKANHVADVNLKNYIPISMHNWTVRVRNKDK